MACVLLVDDDCDIVEVFADILRNAGHEVRAAYSGEQGLRLLRAHPLPDVVVLDVDMPVMDGPTMAHQMLLHDAGEEKIPVVLVSARIDLAQIAGRVGTRYFLAKTGDIDAFVAMIARAIREGRAPLSA